MGHNYTTRSEKHTFNPSLIYNIYGFTLPLIYIYSNWERDHISEWLGKIVVH